MQSEFLAEVINGHHVRAPDVSIRNEDIPAKSLLACETRHQSEAAKACSRKGIPKKRRLRRIPLCVLAIIVQEKTNVPTAAASSMKDYSNY
jgi:hypothetical protein